MQCGLLSIVSQYTTSLCLLVYVYFLPVPYSHASPAWGHGEPPSRGARYVQIIIDLTAREQAKHRRTMPSAKPDEFRLPCTTTYLTQHGGISRSDFVGNLAASCMYIA